LSASKRKLLFIDRDGTVIAEPPDRQIDSLEKLQLLPGAAEFLGRIAREMPYHFVMVTNQDGLGTESFPEENFWPAQSRMLELLAQQGVRFDEVLIDRSFPEENAPTRKPGTGMLAEYLRGPYDLAGSYVIGDRLTDMQLAKNLGSRGIWLTLGHEAPDSIRVEAEGLCGTVEWIVPSWEDVYVHLKEIGGK